MTEETNSSNKSYKILFRFYSDVLEKWTVETLWATAVDVEKGWYRLDNIPFYVKSIACDDVVFAEYDEDEQFLTFRDVVQSSGNSTIQIVVMDPALETKSIRALFDALGCSSEEFQERYFVIDVPSRLSYHPVKSLLDKLFANDSIDYSEACLSDKHSSETE
jgi:hypothetical protein